MKTKQILRERLGFSQKAFAQYLYISSSQLAMYEAGQRDLPTATVVQLAEIALFFNQNQTSSEELELLIKNQELKLQETLAKQTKELEYKFTKEQRTLDAIVKKYNQSINLYYFAKFANQNHSVQDEVLLQEALNGIEKNSLAVQLNQQLKLQAVKSQLEYVTQTLKKYEKT